jgi:hypothetical protein
MAVQVIIQFVLPHPTIVYVGRANWGSCLGIPHPLLTRK